MKKWEINSGYYLILGLIFLGAMVYLTYQAQNLKPKATENEAVVRSADKVKVEKLIQSLKQTALDNKFFKQIQFFGEYPVKPSNTGKNNPFFTPDKPVEQLLDKTGAVKTNK